MKREQSEQKIIYRQAAKDLLRIGSATLPLQIIKAAFPFANAIITSKIGSDERNAVTLINAFTDLSNNVFYGPLSQVQTRISSATKDEVGREAQGSWIYALVLSLPQILLLTMTKPILTSSGQDSTVTDIVTRFFKIYVGAVPLLGLLLVSEQVGLGTNIIYFPVITQAIGLGSYLLLSTPLALGEFGVPKQGIDGAAYGSLARAAITTTITFGSFAYLSRRGRRLAEYKIYNRHHDLKTIVVDSLKKGLPLFFIIGSEVGMMYAINMMVGKFDADMLSAQLVVSQYQDIMLIFSSACGTAAQNMVASNLKKNPQHAMVYGNLSVLFSLAPPILFTVLALLIPETLIRIFIDPNDPDDQNIVQMLVDKKLLLISGVTNIAMAIRYVYTQALMGANKIDLALLGNMLTTWIGVCAGITASCYLENDQILYLNIGLSAGFIISGIAQSINWFRKAKNLPLENKPEEQPASSSADESKSEEEPEPEQPLPLSPSKLGLNSRDDEISRFNVFNCCKSKKRSDTYRLLEDEDQNNSRSSWCAIL
jgi:multidrug resistance protein, MATE family